jgi:hypothetical protein
LSLSSIQPSNTPLSLAQNPLSKLRGAKISTGGFKQLTYFTHWSWVLLGAYFLLTLLPSAYAEYAKYALLVWEVAAPNALLVTIIVSFVIWPEKIKLEQDTTGLGEGNTLAQHCFNTVMVVCELHFGATPLILAHAPLVPLYGLAYVLFAWIWSHRVSPKHGVQFYYFFLDTTLPPMLSVACFLALLAIILLFFFIASYIGVGLVYAVEEGYHSSVVLGGLITGTLAIVKYED